MPNGEFSGRERGEEHVPCPCPAERPSGRSAPRWTAGPRWVGRARSRSPSSSERRRNARRGGGHAKSCVRAERVDANCWKAALPVFRKYSRLASCVSCHSTSNIFRVRDWSIRPTRGGCAIDTPLRAGILVEPARCSSPRFRTVLQPKRARAVRTRRRAPPSRAPSSSRPHATSRSRPDVRVSPPVRRAQAPSRLRPRPRARRSSIVVSSRPRASRRPFAPRALARARNALTPRVVASHPTRGRVVVRLAPRAVAAGGSDLKIGAAPDDDGVISPDPTTAPRPAPNSPTTPPTLITSEPKPTAVEAVQPGGSGDGGGLGRFRFQRFRFRRFRFWIRLRRVDFRRPAGGSAGWAAAAAEKAGFAPWTADSARAPRRSSLRTSRRGRRCAPPRVGRGRRAPSRDDARAPPPPRRARAGGSRRRGIRKGGTRQAELEDERRRAKALVAASDAASWDLQLVAPSPASRPSRRSRLSTR